MGYNCTVVVLHDALDQIEKDPNFGRNLANAIMSQYGHPRPCVSAGNHCNAAYVVESHHADHDVLVQVGGNMGRVVESRMIEGTRVTVAQLIAEIEESGASLEEVCLETGWPIDAAKKALKEVIDRMI